MRSWLHRRGWVRVINSGRDSSGRQADTYVQVAGPAWLARRMARWAVLHDPYYTHSAVERSSLRLGEPDVVGCWLRRYHVSYRLVPR